MTDEMKNAELTDATLEQVNGGEGGASLPEHYCPYCNGRHPLNKQQFITLDKEFMADAAALWRGYCGCRNRYFVEKELKGGGLRYYDNNEKIIPTTGA